MRAKEKKKRREKKRAIKQQQKGENPCKGLAALHCTASYQANNTYTHTHTHTHARTYTHTQYIAVERLENLLSGNSSSSKSNTDFSYTNMTTLASSLANDPKSSESKSFISTCVSAATTASTPSHALLHLLPLLPLLPHYLSASPPPPALVPLLPRSPTPFDSRLLSSITWSLTSTVATLLNPPTSPDQSLWHVRGSVLLTLLSSYATSLPPRTFAPVLAHVTTLQAVLSSPELRVGEGRMDEVSTLHKFVHGPVVAAAAAAGPAARRQQGGPPPDDVGGPEEAMSNVLPSSSPYASSLASSSNAMSYASNLYLHHVQLHRFNLSTLSMMRSPKGPDVGKNARCCLATPGYKGEMLAPLDR